MNNSLFPVSNPVQTKSPQFQKHLSLQFITHYTEQYDYVASARLALEGGCRWIQLRMKEAPEEEFCRAATQIGPLCTQFGAVFLLDDRVELVRELRADGVHLGKQDMPIAEARELLGDRYIIGGTASTYEEVVQYAVHGADYVGCGPFRFTTTKKNLALVLGLEGYASICSRLKEEKILIPVVAIGGITSEDIPALLSCGISGIALSGSVLRANNPVSEMKTVQELIHATRTP